MFGVTIPVDLYYYAQVINPIFGFFGGGGGGDGGDGGDGGEPWFGCGGFGIFFGGTNTVGTPPLGIIIFE